MSQVLKRKINRTVNQISTTLPNSLTRIWKKLLICSMTYSTSRKKSKRLSNLRKNPKNSLNNRSLKSNRHGKRWVKSRLQKKKRLSISRNNKSRLTLKCLSITMMMRTRSNLKRNLSSFRRLVLTLGLIYLIWKLRRKKWRTRTLKHLTNRLTKSSSRCSRTSSLECSIYSLSTWRRLTWTENDVNNKKNNVVKKWRKMKKGKGSNKSNSSKLNLNHNLSLNLNHNQNNNNRQIKKWRKKQHKMFIIKRLLTVISTVISWGSRWSMLWGLLIIRSWVSSLEVLEDLLTDLYVKASWNSGNPSQMSREQLSLPCRNSPC
jgi:hypothetical protein